MARCIQELERIKGIQNGGDRKSDRDNLHYKNNSIVIWGYPTP